MQLDCLNGSIDKCAASKNYSIFNVKVIIDFLDKKNFGLFFRQSLQVESCV